MSGLLSDWTREYLIVYIEKLHIYILGHFGTLNILGHFGPCRIMVFFNRKFRIISDEKVFRICLDWFVSRYGDVRFERSWCRLKAESDGFQTAPRSSKTDITMTRYGSSKTNPELFSDLNKL